MIAFFRYFTSAILLLLLTLFLCDARVLPKIKRDNTTCCGYTITNRDNVYFKNKYEMDFSTLTSLDPVYLAGWDISHGWKVGSTNAATGQVARGNETNVKVVPGVGLSLTVPGGQDPNATTFSAVEFQFPDIIMGGIIEVDMQLTNVPGTAMSFMTYHADNVTPLGWKDQQGFQMLGETLLVKNAYNAAGMRLTNFDPTTGKREITAAAFPVDPSQGFHKYSISWFPDICTGAVNPARATQYRFDGAVLSAPALGSSTHPSRMFLNQYTTADKLWSAGPPKTDAVMIVKRVVAYYDKPTKVGEGACPIRGDCDPSISCKVTI